MKKCVTVILALVLVLSLVGCGFGAKILQYPPELTVVCGEEKTEAMTGTISWRYRAGQQMRSITTSVPHPLTLKEQLTPLVLPGTSPEALMGSLEWEVMPDVVSACCWSGEIWGQPDAAGEDVPVETGTEAAKQYTIPLKDGEYIYQVDAQWNSAEDYGGTVSFVFYTVGAQLAG